MAMKIMSWMPEDRPLSDVLNDDMFKK